MLDIFCKEFILFSMANLSLHFLLPSSLLLAGLLRFAR